MGRQQAMRIALPATVSSPRRPQLSWHGRGCECLNSCGLRTLNGARNTPAKWRRGVQLARISHLCEMGLFFAGILGEFPCLLGHEWGFADLGSGFRAMGAARSGFEARLVFAMGF